MKKRMLQKKNHLARHKPIFKLDLQDLWEENLYTQKCTSLLLKEFLISLIYKLQLIKPCNGLFTKQTKTVFQQVMLPKINRIITTVYKLQVSFIRCCLTDDPASIMPLKKCHIENH